MDEAKLEARLRRTAWIQLAIGIALIPLVYWLMVEVLLPRFWLEDEKSQNRSLMASLFTVSLSMLRMQKRNE